MNQEQAKRVADLLQEQFNRERELGRMVVQYLCTRYTVAELTHGKCDHESIMGMARALGLLDGRVRAMAAVIREVAK